MDRLKWRQGAAADEPLLFALFAADKAREFAPLGLSAEQLQPLLEMQFRARQVGYAQSYAAAVDSILCLEDDTPVGRHLIERQADCYRCIDLAVLPEYRSRGIGAWALRQIQQVAALESIPFRLCVSRSNPALKLYERLGFLKASSDELSFEMEWQPSSMGTARPRVQDRMVLSTGIEIDRKDVLDRVCGFLCEIGLSVCFGAVPSTSFLPGIQTVSGGLRIDPGALLYPGDLLHEAGHLAVMTPACRNQEFPNSKEPAEEMAALAWSYAAAVHIGIAPEIVFHEHGYRGQAQPLVEGFRQGRSVGQPMLAWYGMTTTALPGSPSIYPRMLRWMREAPSETGQVESHEYSLHGG